MLQDQGKTPVDAMFQAPKAQQKRGLVASFLVAAELKM
jgi:hypothetical protein